MFGHGLGTCARQRPFMGSKSQDVLRPGMVLALGTHLYRPPYGGLRLEYPILITETAAEPLCETPHPESRFPPMR
jgi:Xaa-Pro dipeptidase